MLNKFVIVLCFLGFGNAMAQEALPENSENVPSQEKKLMDSRTTLLPKGAKQLLEGTAAVGERNKKIVDFPNRSSLGTIEDAPLPSPQDKPVAGPTDINLLKTSMPSEQLIGRISPEVFRELADLERTNMFLKLQMQKEQLRNDLEKLQSSYRQGRLDEVEKRENVIRNRISWWQEQEAIRADIESKKAQATLLDEQIVEAEAMRKQMRQKALAATDGTGEFDLSEIYAVIEIKGIKGNLIAKLKPVAAENVISVKKGDKLLSGHIIKKIEATKVIAEFNGKESEASLVFVPATDKN